MNLSNIFNISLIYVTFRYATPIIYASMSASMSKQADILNVGTEGIMLTSCFTAVTAAYFSGSWLVGCLAAMVTGLLIASIMAVGHIRYNADITAIGTSINLFAIAITRYLVTVVFHKAGSFTDPAIPPIPTIHLAFLDNIPILNDIFNNWKLTEWLVIVLVIFLTFLFYKTVWGLRLRAVGRFPLAAQSAGINVDRMKYQAIMFAGLIAGLGGAHLSLGYSCMYSDNMTYNRGFMGIAAMYFGSAHPVAASAGALIFGLVDSVGSRLQPYGLPSHLVLASPYVITIAVLAISLWVKKRREIRKKSALAKLPVQKNNQAPAV